MLHRWLVVMTAGLALLASAGAGEGPRKPGGLSAEVAAHLDLARARGLYRDPSPGVLSPRLSDLSRTVPDRTITVWVFFTDKGIGTPESLERGVQRFREDLGDDARKRRALVDEGLAVDFRDLPVYAPYVESLGRMGFSIRRVSRWVNGASLRMKAHRLSELQSLPFVRWVQPVFVKREDIPVEETAIIPPAGLYPGASSPVPASIESSFYGPSFKQNEQIHVLELHRLGYTGAGVKVMMIDTGFKKTHPAFACTDLEEEYDYINEDGNTQNEMSEHPFQHNHGTGVWGTAGAYAPGYLIGPAFGATFYLAKTEDITQEVRAEEDDYVAALEWADLEGVEVTSASLAYLDFDNGFEYPRSDLDGATAVVTIAVDVAVSRGIACVNAMGNTGPADTTLETPADADSVVAVGAVDSTGAVAGFSSRGPSADGRIKPDVSARGVSTMWASAGTDSFVMASGTSLATPLIGGLAALLKEAHPSWTGAEIRAALIGTATRPGAPNNSLGYGIAHGLSALTFAGPSPSAPRTTLPFYLVSPAQAETVLTSRPTFVWTESEAANLGDAAEYTLLLSTTPDFLVSSQVAVGPDSTHTLGSSLNSGTTYYWKVEALGNQGYVRKSMNILSFTVDPAVSAEGPEPLPVGLRAASPNPMRHGTRILFRLMEGDEGVLEIVSVDGRLVRRLEVTGSGGEDVFLWDGLDERGARVASGVYYYRLRTPEESWSQKLVVIP